MLNNKENCYLELANHLFYEFNSNKLKESYNAENAKKVINFEIMLCGNNVIKQIPSDNLKLINNLPIKTISGIKPFNLSNFYVKEQFDLFLSGETITKDGNNWSNKVYAIMQDSLGEAIDDDLGVDKKNDR